jgi:hypothetical protein
LEFSTPVSVDLKNSFNINADLTVAPQNITASPSQSNVSLSLGYYNYYEIERATGGGAFSVISPPNWWGSSYYDNTVTTGSTYRYRARLTAPSYYFGPTYVYASRSNNYTNTVTATIP